MIDEWQVIPFIWNQIRTEVDRRDEFGQFLLTGSKQPDEAEDVDKHSGTGRIASLMMRPMSLFESGESNGIVSLESLFGGGGTPGRCDTTLRDYAFYTARGGWPISIGLDEDVVLEQAVGYVEGIIDPQMNQLLALDGTTLDPPLGMTSFHSVSSPFLTEMRVPVRNRSSSRHSQAFL